MWKAIFKEQTTHPLWWGIIQSLVLIVQYSSCLDNYSPCLSAWILARCKLGKSKHNSGCLRWKKSNSRLQTHHASMPNTRTSQHRIHAPTLEMQTHITFAFQIGDLRPVRIHMYIYRVGIRKYTFPTFLQSSKTLSILKANIKVCSN